MSPLFLLLEALCQEPQVRIQDLLTEVNGWVNFTRFFKALRGRHASIEDFVKGVLAALIAKGCNIGMTKMAALTPDIKPGTLNRISEIYLYEDTLRRVIEHFVTTTHSLPIASAMTPFRCRMG